ncbi:HupE/UreJ family protein [Flavobacterium sp.]|uniref:HupE/UreJ family protein n=1 Tax=Flavobacterium sp. TaxID=239 RepID=UPI00286D1F57|nr:HupE/UreJ family protein [Flavobacterium sp.]
MSDFWIYVEIGLKHVLNIKSYDHVLFLMALTVPHTFNDWKKILLLVTVFTIGHTLALVLSVFQIVMIKAQLVEFLIPITILITAIFNFFSVGKASKKESVNSIVLITLFFGVIHGLGFSNYFKTILPGNPSDKVMPLLEFALGIEGAQMTVVLAILILSYFLQTFFKFSKRDFTIVTSAFIVGVVMPMILQNEIWN